MHINHIFLDQDNYRRSFNFKKEDIIEQGAGAGNYVVRTKESDADAGADVHVVYHAYRVS